MIARTIFKRENFVNLLGASYVGVRFEFGQPESDWVMAATADWLC